MIKNYFKTAIRSLLKNKTFSIINIAGLAIGIASFLLIVNYLRFEYSFDDFHVNKDRIFRVPMTVTEAGGKLQTFAFTYPALAPAIKKDYPEIEEVARFRKQGGVVRYGDQKFIENSGIIYVDPAVFKIFSFQFAKGQPSTAFQELNDAVITKETAKKYFGDLDPIGKALNYRNENYIVKAVLEDLPANSHLQFHILLNYNKYIQLTENAANTSWGWSDFYTYILLKPNASAEALQAKMPAFAERYMGTYMKRDGFKVAFQIEPLKDIHLRSTYDYELGGNGNLYYLKYLGIAALLILVIALVNYINLSTARSMERSREVGLRKVVGATKFQLVRQFLSESFLLNACGIIAGFILFKISLSKFSLLINQQVSTLDTADSRFWILIGIVLLLTTLLAGFYPSFVLSSFQPIETLKQGKGSIKRSRDFLRKALVVFQFTAAILLIGGAIGFFRQLQFMSKRDLGVNIQQTLVISQSTNLDSSKAMNVAALMDQLIAIPGVESATASTDVPGNEVGSSTTFRKKAATYDKRVRTFGIDGNYIPNYGLTLVAGRNIDRDEAPGADTNKVYSVILNETASKLLGFEKPADAIGQLVDGAGFHCRVIGVVNDYHQQSLQYSYDPIVFYPEQGINCSRFSLKLNTKDPEVIVARTKSIWSNLFPQSPFQYFFLDEYFNRQYENDRLFSTILWLFTILAIIVASLGLFGLSLYTVSKRIKEISIRKVLGASATQITAMITRDYLKLILYAGILAIPSAYFLLRNWLSDYAFHIEIGYWFLLFPMLLISCIALLTVLYQSLRAAFTNPAKNLRSE
jgi:putative ABC transport system permease protein